MDRMEQLNACLAAIRQQTDFIPDVALVLGSGLGGFARCIDVCASVPYHTLPGFPVSTVPGHAGQYLFGTLDGVKLVVMQGRIHYYEGYDVSQVVLPIRLMGLLGAKKLFLTNAAGGINPAFAQGALMAITDHIGSLIPSPLRGPNLDALGVRFPDMSHVYSPQLLQIMQQVAQEEAIALQTGVYIQTPGPNFETPAEIRAYALMGADAVGMSTAVEAIAARHMGMEVCAVSCITNMAAGRNTAPLTHEEVQETADRVAGAFQKLVAKTIVRIGAGK